MNEFLKKAFLICFVCLGQEAQSRSCYEVFQKAGIQKAFKRALIKAKFKKLSLYGYKGSKAEFERKREEILDKNGEPIAKYIGQPGQALFAKAYYGGDMFKAFTNISAFLTKTEFKKLGWHEYHGLAAEFERERKETLDKIGPKLETVSQMYFMNKNMTIH